MIPWFTISNILHGLNEEKIKHFVRFKFEIFFENCCFY
jgi:hypothetical protein